MREALQHEIAAVAEVGNFVSRTWSCCITSMQDNEFCVCQGSQGWKPLHSILVPTQELDSINNTMYTLIYDMNKVTSLNLLLRPIRRIYCNYATKDTLSKLLKTRKKKLRRSRFHIRSDYSWRTFYHHSMYQHGVLVMRTDNHCSYPLPLIEIEITSSATKFSAESTRKLPYQIQSANRSERLSRWIQLRNLWASNLYHHRTKAARPFWLNIWIIGFCHSNIELDQ